MIVVIDVYYWEDKAKSVSIEIEDWETENLININEVEVDEIEEYVSGEFYKRELPCILKVLESSKKDKIEVIIIDGYVVLNYEGKLGLGGYLYKELGELIPIIGVAKKNFISNTKNVREVLRGTSKKPLYISSVGINIDEASKKIKNMKGENRIPNLLKLVDRLSKEKGNCG